MKSVLLCLVPALGFAAAALHPSTSLSQDSPLAGVWTLNRSLSELPREIGFKVGWLPTSGDAGEPSGSRGGADRPRGRGRIDDRARCRA
jgi:hypothetical protein